VALDSLLFPTTCPVCDADTVGSPFCPGCRDELARAAGPSCPRCAMPVGPFGDVGGGCSECRGRSLGFDGAVALGPYSGPIRNLCLELKHERNAWLAPWLAEVLVQGRLGAIRETAGLPAGARPGAWVVPVPLHWRRRMARGYNQAEELARGLGRSLGLEVRPGVLRRVVATPKLALIGRSERERLMRGVFRARRDPALRGRTVLLVDDVLTSGATAGAAARALKRAGAKRVVVVVVARAEGKP